MRALRTINTSRRLGEMRAVFGFWSIWSAMTFAATLLASSVVVAQQPWGTQPAQPQVVQAVPQPQYVAPPSAQTSAAGYGAPANQMANSAANPSHRTVILDERTNELVEVRPQVQYQPEPTIHSYSYGNQRFQGGSVQEQPVTIVQDSPLNASPAEQMRKQRQNAEAGTEDGIVQALEKARMEDEMRRRDRFNGAIGTGAAPATTQGSVSGTTQSVEQVAPVVVAAPPVAEEEEKVDIKSEIRAALKEAHEEESAKPKQQMYIGGMVGMGQYPDVANVRGNTSAGFSIGVITPERVVAEGSFTYGMYEIEDTRYTNSVFGYANIYDMKQYNMAAALKYLLLPGKVRPSVGAVASYTRRSMSNQSTGYESRTSDAFDAGVLAGVDLQLTETLALGFEMRYLTNIGYRQKTDYPQSFVNNRSNGQYKDIEQLDYYQAGLTARLNF